MVDSQSTRNYEVPSPNSVKYVTLILCPAPSLPHHCPSPKNERLTILTRSRRAMRSAKKRRDQLIRAPRIMGKEDPMTKNHVACQTMCHERYVYSVYRSIAKQSPSKNSPARLTKQPFFSLHQCHGAKKKKKKEARV